MSAGTTTPHDGPGRMSAGTFTGYDGLFAACQFFPITGFLMQ